MRWLPKAMLGLLVLSCTWNISHADMLTSNVIFGSGNSNEYFTVTQQNGVEIGLRAKTRYPAPQNSDQSSTLGYTLNEGDYYFVNPTDVTQPNRGSWNLDWSVNTNYLGTTGGPNISSYDYGLTFSFAPQSGMGPAPSVGLDPLPSYNDAWYGTNSTAPGGGTVGVDAQTTSALAANNNVAQNSTNIGFFPFFPNPADVNTPGIYTIALTVFDQGQIVATNQIHVYAGVQPPAAVPEPTSMAIFGLGTLGLIGGRMARKRLKQKRESAEN